jgi:hypothetical protein
LSIRINETAREAKREIERERERVTHLIQREELSAAQGQAAELLREDLEDAVGLIARQERVRQVHDDHRAGDAALRQACAFPSEVLVGLALGDERLEEREALAQGAVLTRHFAELAHLGDLVGE